MEDKLILLVEDNPHIMAINDAALHTGAATARCRRKLHTSAGSCCAFTRWT